MKNVVLGYDEGPSVGLGHRRRIAALARAFRDAGVPTSELALTGPISGACVVVDSYRHRGDDRALIDADLVIAVDDIDRNLAVDVVVDPSPGAQAGVHVAARCVLAGARYALIGPGLPDTAPRTVGDAITRVLVTLGGADQGDLGGSIATAVAALMPEADVQLAVGPWSGTKLDSRIQTVHVEDGLGPWLASADIVVTAGGVTLLESLCLGRPTIVLQIADNQHQATTAACAAGAALRAAVDPAAIAAAVRRLADDPHRRRLLADAATRLIDRDGPKRVVETVLVGTHS